MQQVMGVKRQVMSAEFRKPSDMTMSEALAVPLLALMEAVAAQAPHGSAVNVVSVSLTQRCGDSAFTDLVGLCERLVENGAIRRGSEKDDLIAGIRSAKEGRDDYFMVCVIEQVEFAPMIASPSGLTAVH